ncbi:MAG: SCP2 sterol-binding domain-containing protein [Thiohalocapsa sp.]
MDAENDGGGDASPETGSEGIPIPDAVLAAIETAVNTFLSLDPEGARRLSRVQGHVLRIELTGFGSRIHVVPGESRLMLYGNYDAEPDCTVRGTPAGLLRMALSEHRENAVFEGTIQIDGDNQVAQTLGDVVQGLDIDWEELLSKVLGDTLAHRLGVQARVGERWARRSGDTLTQDVREYLQEEARLLPNADEVRGLIDDVDRLRDDVERLAARIERLAPRRPPS